MLPTAVRVVLHCGPTRLRDVPCAECGGDLLQLERAKRAAAAALPCHVSLLFQSLSSTALSLAMELCYT